MDMIANTSPTLKIIGKVQKKPRKRMVWIILLCFTLATAIAGMIIYINHWQHRALPGTTIGALQVEGMKKEQVTHLLEKQSKTITLNLTGDARAKIKIESLGLEPDITATVQDVFKPNRSYIKILESLFSVHKVTPKASFNDELALQKARELNPDGEQIVQDSHISITPEGNFAITPGHAGLGINSQTLKAGALEAWKEQKNKDLKIHLETVQPIENSDHLQQWIEKADRLISSPVLLETPRGRKFKIDKKNKASWVSFPPATLTTEKLKNSEPTLDKTKIHTWLAQFTEEKINYTPPKGKRRLSKDGKLLQLLAEPSPGIRANNLEQISDEIYRGLSSNQAVHAHYTTEKTEGQWEDILTEETRELAYKASPGQKWICVDVSNNTTTAYEGDQIVWGPKASVGGSAPSPTITGTFKVYLKRRSQIMKGEGWDGPYEVWTPWVMYFHREYAIHGAPWRRNMVYTPYGGSHGCVNMTTEDAKWLYDWAPLGTVVVTHR